MVYTYNGDSTKWKADEKAIYDELIKQARAKGDHAYADQTVRWMKEESADDGDGVRILTEPPERIKSKVTLQNRGTRAVRIRTDEPILVR